MTIDNVYMEYARKVSFFSTCDSSPKRAVIVRGGDVISYGFNNVPFGIEPCNLKYGCCYREKLGYLAGEGLQFCRGIHAESSAIVNAAKNGLSIEHAILYTTHLPCSDCTKLILNSGIKRVVYLEEYPTDTTVDLFLQANILLEKITV